MTFNKQLRLVADLAAERAFSAEKGNEKIVVEIKSFINPSFIYDLERAVGQYIVYRNFLSRTAPEYKLYLALSQLVYNAYFNSTIQIVLDDNDLKLIIVDTNKEVITQWRN